MPVFQRQNGICRTSWPLIGDCIPYFVFRQPLSSLPFLSLCPALNSLVPASILFSFDEAAPPCCAVVLGLWGYPRPLFRRVAEHFRAAVRRVLGAPKISTVPHFRFFTHPQQPSRSTLKHIHWIWILSCFASKFEFRFFWCSCEDVHSKDSRLVGAAY